MQAYQNTNSAEFRCQNTINPNVAQAVRYWAREFDVSPSKLLEVMAEVGRNVAEVSRRLSH